LAAQPSAVSPAPATEAAADASITNLKNARVISLAIPAPRGQILARDGEAFAQNRVAFHLALMFPQFENADQSFVVDWARKRLAELRVIFPKCAEKSDEELWAHYRHRRWLPLYLSGFQNRSQATELAKKLGQRKDLVLYPVYARHYPEDSLAAHIVGYTGSVGKLPTGPINFNEPLWELTEGRSGLEMLYNKNLAGTPGMKRLLYNNEGVQLADEMVRPAIAGTNVVTTLSMKWQRHAEKVLREGSQRSAMVVIDIQTGEILVMASRPSFDLNEFVGGINSARYKELNEDPAAPLFGRAFSAQYPPASTFKSVVALAGLQSEAITENSTIDAPAFIEFPGHKIRNASGRAEGSIAVRFAMARSTNTWFAKLGIEIGPTTFLSMARRCGYGERTGLPLIGEAPGLLPTREWMQQHHKRGFMNGDTANMSIGQGVLLATPLQVCQGMAAIGNGRALPRLHLIRQVQDTRGRVVFQAMPETRTPLELSEAAVTAVHRGMRDVINEGYGTGRAGGLSWTTNCGKTGTAQWGPPSKNQRLAWFAGYFPFENPRFAYAVVYEGRPGQVISGGRYAAPLVKNFFDPLRKEIEEIIAPPKKAIVVSADSGESKDPLVP
jgi:penicillin-binding protein 2